MRKGKVILVLGASYLACLEYLSWKSTDQAIAERNGIDVGEVDEGVRDMDPYYQGKIGLLMPPVGAILLQDCLPKLAERKKSKRRPERFLQSARI
jgi:hypothetical protein